MRLILCFFLPAMMAIGADLRAGAAEVIITPPPGAPMAGYYTNRAATGVHDDLHAKALVFEKSGVRVALVRAISPTCRAPLSTRRAASSARKRELLPIT